MSSDVVLAEAPPLDCASRGCSEEEFGAVLSSGIDDFSKFLS